MILEELIQIKTKVDSCTEVTTDVNKKLTKFESRTQSLYQELNNNARTRMQMAELMDTQ